MHNFSVGNKLYFSVLSVFLIFAVSFIVFQQYREKQFKIDTLNLKLQNYNNQMNSALSYIGKHDNATLTAYTAAHKEKDLRITLISTNGKVIFDSSNKEFSKLPNHSNRPEFIQALKSGHGSTVERQSRTMKRDYFYSATFFPKEGYVIRSALPYNNDLAKSLSTDQHYIWFALIAMTILTFVLYRFINKLGQNITKLRIFSLRVDHNESLDIEDLAEFPDDELGEIAERIIKIYKRLQSTRKEQDVLKRQLTQNVAHELKTPVASIKGYLETILDNPHIDEVNKQQFLERCFVQSERLTSLLQDISTLNRMDDAPDIRSFDDVDINAMIIQIQKETALQLQKKGMTFNNNLRDNIIIKGNRSLLYSVFRNLTDNAIAYAGEGTTITLNCINNEGKWNFTFSDNGVGVTAQHLSRLFERFYRVDKGRSRNMGGTGLGLAIVKNAILLHEGTIKVKNNITGGLCFEFSLKA